MRDIDVTLAITELNALRFMRLRDLVDDQMYATRKEKLILRLAEYKARLADISGEVAEGLELGTFVLLIANKAQKHFLNGDLRQKRRTVEMIGSNFTLKDQKLHIEAKIPFAIVQGHTEIRSWQGKKESNPHPWFWRPVFYH